MFGGIIEALSQVANTMLTSAYGNNESMLMMKFKNVS
jgi:hypothetical protein